VLLAIVIAAVTAAAPAPAIRVGGPSDPADAKVAVVGGGSPGTKFKVLRDGDVVLRGKLKATVGDTAPWRRAAYADITRITTPGRYVIKVGKRKSRAWVVAAGAHDKLIARLLRIYQVNADGNEPSPVFGPAHLNDATLEDGRKVDLTGGWRDAGDTLKFTRTIAQSVAYLHLAARMAPNSAAQLKATAAIGERYLLKAHPFPAVFVHTVGDQRDHDTGFRDPATDDASGLPGIAQRTAYATTSSDVLGMTAAALAISGHVTEAKAWYEQAKQTNGFQPADREYYPDDSFHDELAFGATELWRATGEQQYLDDAAEQLGLGSDNELYGGVVVGAPRGIVVADLCGGLGAAAAPGAVKDAACGDLQKIFDAALERAYERAFGSPGIYTFGWVQDNGGAGIIGAAMSRAGLDPDGRNLAASALDYMRGRNQWGRSFIVGPARFEAHQPHHAAFLKGTPSDLLNGAVVGGAAGASDVSEQGLRLKGKAAERRYDGAGIVYDDVRADYVTSEVGLGYSAPAILLAAALEP
jgi:hypothetical protein